MAEMFVHRGSGVDSCTGASALAKEGICVRTHATDDLLQGIIMAMVRPMDCGGGGVSKQKAVNEME
jgi:hypothetical protein